MDAHDLALIGLAIISETLGTVSGFGSSTFFVPTAVWLEPFQLVLAITALLHVFGNLSKLSQFKAKLPRRLVYRLAVPSVALTGVGALLTRFVPVEIFKIALGAALILIPAARWLLKAGDRHLPMSWSLVFTGLSGFLTGLVGTGGALRGLVLAGLGLDKATFIVLSSTIDLGGDVLRAGVYLSQGYLDAAHWFYVP